MKKKTWKIIVRHLVLALLAIIWLIPANAFPCAQTSVFPAEIPFHYKGCKLPALLPGTLDTGKLSSTVLQDRYSSKLPCMV